ncbi:MAG: hypothetical protein WCW31_01735 [Patescibacteria group bacterium]|jgi:hypothetical protein
MSFSDISALFRFKYLGPDFDALRAKHPHLAQDQLFFDIMSKIVMHNPDAFKTPVCLAKVAIIDFQCVKMYLMNTTAHRCVWNCLYEYFDTMETRLKLKPDPVVRAAYLAGFEYMWLCTKRIVDWERDRLRKLRP